MGNAGVAGSNGRVRTIALLVASAGALLVWLSLAVPGQAVAATLSGAVSGQALGGAVEPLAGATVTVLDTAADTPVATTGTGPTGAYSVAVPDGLFDVLFEPAPGQSYDSTTVRDVDLNAPRTLDVVLVSRETVHLTGFVRDSGGAGVANVKVVLSGQGGGATSQRTGADGSYSLAVLPGTYQLTATGVNGTFPAVPEGWGLELGQIEMSGDRSRDIVLPATSVLTVEALGAADEPIADALLTLPPLLGASEMEELGLISASSGGGDGRTDSLGRDRFAVFTGAAPPAGKTATIFPPAGSGYGTTSFAVPKVDQDTTVVVRFQGEGPGDTKPPKLTIEAVPNGQNGWFTSSPADVTARASDPAIASLTCSADGVSSEISPVPAPGALTLTFPVPGEGRHRVACAATDESDNESKATAVIRIDSTPPPAPVPSADRPPDLAGSPSWHRDQVGVSFAIGNDPDLADGTLGSGIDAATVPAAETFFTSGEHTALGSVRDLAGNSSAAASLVVYVDATPPTATLQCPVDPSLGTPASAVWLDEDGESGLAGPASGSDALDTGAVGVHQASHIAADLVGHLTTASCDYRVVYPFATAGGIEAPPMFNMRQGKKPRLAVEFSLGGDRGSNVFRSGSPAVQEIDCQDGTLLGSPSAALADAPLRFRANRGTYEYSWDLGALGSEGCVALLLGFDDGTTHEVWLEL